MAQQTYINPTVVYTSRGIEFICQIPRRRPLTLIGAQRILRRTDPRAIVTHIWCNGALGDRAAEDSAFCVGRLRAKA